MFTLTLILFRTNKRDVEFYFIIEIENFIEKIFL